MDAGEICVEVILGILAIFLAYEIGLRGRTDLIHIYHYSEVKPALKKDYTRKMGLGCLIVGIGVLLMPVLNQLSRTEAGYYVGLIAIISGVVLMLHTVKKYNGKLFTF